MVLLCAAAIQEQASLHVFEFTRPGAKHVSVAGGFNGWNKDKNPMSLASDGRTWRAEVKIVPGRYQYKFVVDGKEWVSDPRATSVIDGSGNPNSEVLVEPSDYALLPAKPGDGVVTVSAFRHDRTKTSLVQTGEGLRVLFKARRNDIAQAEVSVGGTRYAASKVTRDDLTDTFVATIPLKTKAYSIRLIDGGEPATFGPYSVPADTHPVAVPKWVSRSEIGRAHV